MNDDLDTLRQIEDLLGRLVKSADQDLVAFGFDTRRDVRDHIHRLTTEPNQDGQR